MLTEFIENSSTSHRLCTGLAFKICKEGFSWHSNAMPRSLKVRFECIPTIKSSLLRNGFPSQKILAEDLGIAQSTVSNFLNGKPVDYANFLEISLILGQEWRNIADLEDNPPQEANVKGDWGLSTTGDTLRDWELESQTSSQKSSSSSPAGDRHFQSKDSSPQSVKVKLLISNSHSDISFAQKLHQGLSTAGHEVTLSGKNTQQQIAVSDYLLLLLSDRSAVSEIVLEQVQLAKELHHTTSQKPAILPICLNLPWESTFPFDLLQLLQGIQPWQWRCGDDISIILSELLHLLGQRRTCLPEAHKLAIHWSAIFPQEKSSNVEDNFPSVGQASRLSLRVTNPPHPLPVAAPEIPEGQVELASQFYIERPPIETRCFETINQPGALIRIKAPRQMGKTSLMARILHHAETQGSKTVALSFQLANKRVFANSDTFLQWFCASIGLELGQLEPLAKCWQLADIIGSNQCCKAYFEECLLSQLSTPLTLGLDEVDRVFESPEIADDFFGLLRALHEESKRRDIWKKFRLVVVHSTEVYIPLDVNKSPFNVGLPIELPEFNSQQIQELARRHGLDWNQEQVTQLMGLVGGHPYLVRLAMYRISRQDVTLDRVVEEAATEAGIYSDHLRRHLWNLEKYPELMAAMKEVVNAGEGVRLRSQLAFKLNSMGLVKLDGNNCTPRCNLYNQYFLKLAN